MEVEVNLIEYAMPALCSFGPLFLVGQAKRPQWDKRLQFAGVLMVSAALLVSWITITEQRGALSILEQRIAFLESQSK